MIHSHGNNNDKESFENHRTSVSSLDMSYHNLRADCEKCFGFCCVALYFSASEGFPIDKDAGKPCLNLQSDFSCLVHKNLRKQGLKGCIAYDCFGAGQKVAQTTYDGYNWRQVPKSAQQMFEVFLIMRQLHEMLWYLTESFLLQSIRPIQDEISSMIKKTEDLTHLDPNSLMELDVEAHRDNVNALLLHTSEFVRTKIRGGNNASSKSRKINSGGVDFFGADLRKTNLRGANLRGACLIAANLRGVDLSGADLIGADLRDANLSGTNLIHSIFLTQAQINTAKGDADTKLPISLVRPKCWAR